MHAVSVGITAFNEEKNIGQLLDAVLHQHLKLFSISEVIVVCSGCTDKTEEIVAGYTKKHKIVRMICQPDREGKCSAINLFLQEASSEFLVLESADTIPDAHAFERLCTPLLDENIGVVASRPYPEQTTDGLLGYMVDMQWRLHHQVSLTTPKFGELIAFRNCLEAITDSAADEEDIARIIMAKGFQSKYVPSAKVKNFGPETLHDLVKQRRRIFGAHLLMKKKFSYDVPTLHSLKIMAMALRKCRLQTLPYFLSALMVEGHSRFLGFLDALRNKNDYLWDSSLTTKHSFSLDYTGYTIVIPVLNEEKNIGLLLKTIFALYPDISVIVSDDGSTDKTKEVVLNIAKTKHVLFLDRSSKKIHGLTISVIDGIEHVKTPFFIVMDGDFQHPPEKIRDFAEYLPLYDVVVGKRLTVKDWSFLRRLMSGGAKFLAKASSLSSKNSCSDIMSGLFGSRTELFQTIISQNYDAFELEGYKVLFDFLKHYPTKLDIKEVGYDFGLRKMGTSKIGPTQIRAFLRSLLR